MSATHSSLTRAAVVAAISTLTPLARGEAEAASAAARPPVQSTTLEVLSWFKPSTEWFLHYAAGEEAGQATNKASVSRGYLTLKLKPTAWLEPRITLDTHQDDSGDFKVRLKYLYGKLVLPRELVVLSRPQLEFGLVHTPWFDFEEHVNGYRMQGSMFIERIGVMNSADMGVTVGGLLGATLPAAYRHDVSKAYPGAWGSFSFGLYNGGGYHAAEHNDDKVLMGRLSLRPLGPFVPNLQLSYFGLGGRGNTEAMPEWNLHDVMLSVEHRYVVATAQAALGRGNQKGTRIDADGRSQDFRGASAFVEGKLPWIQSSVIARYDRLDLDAAGALPEHRAILGYAFHFHDDSAVLLDWDGLYHGAFLTSAPDWALKLTLKVALS